MKKKWLLTLCIGFLTGWVSEGFANQLETFSRFNRFYFGPQFLWFQNKLSIDNAQVDNGQIFYGLRLGYEYWKPSAFYAGAELLASNSVHGFSVFENGQTCHPGKNQGFGNLQARFGYTWNIGSSSIAPFVGVGVYGLSQRSHLGFKESIGYLSMGFRSRCVSYSLFSIGLNAEGFFGNANEKLTLQEVRHKKSFNDFGGKIEIPLALRISQGWDVQITPEYLRLASSQSQNIYGANLLFGYRF